MEAQEVNKLLFRIQETRYNLHITFRGFFPQLVCSQLCAPVLLSKSLPKKADISSLEGGNNNLRSQSKSSSKGLRYLLFDIIF